MDDPPSNLMNFPALTLLFTEISAINLSNCGELSFWFRFIAGFESWQIFDERMIGVDISSVNIYPHNLTCEGNPPIRLCNWLSQISESDLISLDGVS